MKKKEPFALHKISKKYRALGTVIELTLFGTQSKELLDEAFALIQYYEELLTVNRETSELMAINLSAGLEAVQVSAPVYQLTKLAIQKSQEHFGFNAAIGPLVKLWHIGFLDAKLPAEKEIQKQLVLSNPDHILLKDETFSVFLPQKGMELDLGGIAKGYIADRIQDLWHAKGYERGIINLGGNLILMGDPPHHSDGQWRVGIRNPLDNSRQSIVQIIAGEGSVVTSGISERYLNVGGKTYHHIIDPETGYPHDNRIASVTVFSKKSIDGEIETTRLFFADKPQEKWLLEGRGVYGALYVTRDRKIIAVGIPRNQIKILDERFTLI